MLRRLFILAVGAILLWVSGAEAMTGHCAKAPVAELAVSMNDHCEHMMGAEPASDQDAPSETGSSLCCCAIASAPILLQAPYLETPAPAYRIWSRPTNLAGPSIPAKVAIPPPRF